MLSKDMTLGASPAFRATVEVADRYAASDWPILLCGETGSGKEVLARRIHDGSKRRLGAFVPVNCGALPPGLFESELFGFERGSFTGAAAGSRGLVRQAHGGTLFLDEVGDLDRSLQVKLLRFLDSGEVRAVGSARVESADVRILAATNVDLPEAVRSGRFRQDLYERLSVLRVAIPPLRARREDIVPLATAWLDRLGCDYAMTALRPLERFDWPGNVRQLRNLLVRWSVRGRGTADPKLLEELLGEEREAARSSAPTADLLASASLDDIERHVICARLRLFHGNRKRTAEALGIAKSTLHEKLRRWRELEPTLDGDAIPRARDDDDGDGDRGFDVDPRLGAAALGSP
jgi:transcriptional regulator with PAS, ATPase and Fis domain